MENPVAHFEDFAPRARKQRQVGAGHPGLGGQGMDFLEQGGVAHRVQMGGDLVQQQDGVSPSRASDSSRASASMMEISSAFCSPVEQSRASARLVVWRT